MRLLNRTLSLGITSQRERETEIPIGSRSIQALDGGVTVPPNGLPYRWTQYPAVEFSVVIQELRS